MTSTPPASDLAAAVAGQALQDVEHGDNDPAATAELQTRVAVVDHLVPRLVHPAPDKPMCAAWDRQTPMAGGGQQCRECGADSGNDMLCAVCSYKAAGGEL